LFTQNYVLFLVAVRDRMFLKMQDFDYVLPKSNQILPILLNLFKFAQFYQNWPKFCQNLRRNIC